MIVELPNGTHIVAQADAAETLYVTDRTIPHCFAILAKSALAADEAFVLVDLSDTTNFKHVQTGLIRVFSITISGEKTNAGSHILYLGVITEVDATDGTAVWFGYLETAVQATDRFFHQWLFPTGFSLEVNAGVLANLVSNALLADTTWQTDVLLDSPAGNTTSPPGAGDLVARLDRTGGSISFYITVEYTTEA